MNYESRCIRCDTEVTRGAGGFMLTFGFEKGAVLVCEDCKEIVHERDVWNR